MVSSCSSMASLFLSLFRCLDSVAKGLVSCKSTEPVSGGERISIYAYIFLSFVSLYLTLFSHSLTHTLYISLSFSARPLLSLLSVRPRSLLVLLFLTLVDKRELFVPV